MISTGAHAHVREEDPQAQEDEKMDPQADEEPFEEDEYDYTEGLQEDEKEDPEEEAWQDQVRQVVL